MECEIFLRGSIPTYIYIIDILSCFDLHLGDPFLNGFYR